MATPDNLVVIYKELADAQERQGQPQLRDRFLVLAADAANTAGRAAEADLLLARLLRTNPHHMLRPFASFREAMASSDIQNYIAELRRTHPPDQAEAAFDSLRAGRPVHPPVRPTKAIPPTRPTVDFDEEDEPEPLKMYREQEDAQPPRPAPPPRTPQPAPARPAAATPRPAPLPRPRPATPVPDVEAHRPYLAPPSVEPDEPAHGSWLSAGLFVLILAAGLLRWLDGRWRDRFCRILDRGCPICLSRKHRRTKTTKKTERTVFPFVLSVCFVLSSFPALAATAAPGYGRGSSPPPLPAPALTVLRSQRNLVMRAPILCLSISLSLCLSVAHAETGSSDKGHGMVVAVSPPAAEVGLAILKKGGNAVDAAVATAFALAVTYPAAGNIGGGGFMVVYPRRQGRAGRHRLPRDRPGRRHQDDVRQGRQLVRPQGRRRAGHRARPGPGPPALRQAALERPGRCRPSSWPRMASSSTTPLAGSLNWRRRPRRRLPRTAARLRQERRRGDWKAGDRLVQKDLARTLRLIADEGPDAFYKGPIADLIAAEMKAGGGLITKDDLAGYHANARKPIHGTYRGYDVYGPPPPSSGGICLVEMLNILENFDLHKQGRWSPETLHLMIETMRRAYCDRARYLGDPDFAKIPAT